MNLNMLCMYIGVYKLYKVNEPQKSSYRLAFNDYVG